MTLHPMGRHLPSTYPVSTSSTLPPLPRSQSFHYHRPRGPPSSTVDPTTPTFTCNAKNVSGSGHIRRASRDRSTTLLGTAPPNTLSTPTKKTCLKSRTSNSSLLLRRPPKYTARLFADIRLAFQQTNKILSTRQLVVLIGFILAFLITLAYIIAASIRNRTFSSQQREQQNSNVRNQPPKAYWPTSARTLRYRGLGTVKSLDEIQSILSESFSSTLSTSRFFGSLMRLRRLFHRTKRKSVPRFSIIAACAGRTGYLQQVLPSWLETVSRYGSDAEIVVVDWGGKATQIPVQAVTEVLQGVHLVTVTVTNGGENQGWVLTRAYNLAATVARGQWLVKMDCDVGFVGQDVGRKLVLEKADASKEKVFWRGDWRKANGENEKHLNGLFVVKKEDFWNVGGFDERLVAYGWDDEDLYRRLEKSGLKKKVIDGGVVHVGRWASNERGNMAMTDMLTTEMNQLTLDRIKSWSQVEKEERATYEFACREVSCRFLEAKVWPRSVPASKQLSTEDRQHVLQESSLRVLHDGYQIPWAVLSEVNRTPVELVRALSNAVNGLIFCEVGGTAAQRVLGIASAIALARKYSRPVFLSWSSGKRGGSDHVPRVADFFDIENSGLMDHSDHHKRGVQIFQVGRWKCRFASHVCAENDPVYNDMIEYRATKRREDNIASFKDIIRRLTPQSGESASFTRQNILLRLEGILPMLPSVDIERALNALVPSRLLVERVNSYGPVSDKFGIYLGRGIRKRGLDAMMKRLHAHGDEKAKYFVTGAERDQVSELRVRLGDTSNRTGEAGNDGEESEVESTARDVAELLVLAKCTSLVNDGRSPEDVAVLVQLIKRGKRKERA